MRTAGLGCSAVYWQDATGSGHFQGLFLLQSQFDTFLSVNAISRDLWFECLITVSLIWSTIKQTLMLCNIGFFKIIIRTCLIKYWADLSSSKHMSAWGFVHQLMRILWFIDIIIGPVSVATHCTLTLNLKCRVCISHFRALSSSWMSQKSSSALQPGARNPQKDSKLGSGHDWIFWKDRVEVYCTNWRWTTKKAWKPIKALTVNNHYKTETLMWFSMWLCS